MGKLPMPTFSYQAESRDGQKLAGTVEAESLALAIDRVRALGYFPASVSAREDKTTRSSVFESVSLHGFIAKFTPRLEILKTTRDLTCLLSAGISLPFALSILREKQKSETIRKLLTELADEVKNGVPLSETIAGRPEAFDEIYVGMVRQGERKNELSETLQKFVGFIEAQDALAGKVKKAEIYSIAALLLGSVVVLLFLAFALPVLTNLYDIGLLFYPSWLYIFFRFSEYLRDSPAEILIVTLSAGGAIALMLRMNGIRAITDAIVLRLPVVGSICRKIETARFVRAFGTLLGTGALIGEAASIAIDSIRNRSMKRRVGRAIQIYCGDETVSELMSRSGVFPPGALASITAGESKGKVDAALIEVADYYSVEVEFDLSRILRVVIPCIALAVTFFAVLLLSLVNPEWWGI